MSQQQKLDKLNTGMEGLDDALQELFAICEDKKRLNSTKEAIANKDISAEEFSKVVPYNLVRLSIGLTGSQFQTLLENVNKEAVDLVKEANTLIEKHFAGLFENENAKSIYENEKEKYDHAESLSDETINSTAYYLIWEDNPPNLLPAVRMAFKNEKTKILLNTRLDWADLSFLLKDLSNILAELLEKGKPLAELGQLNLSYSQIVAENIEDVLANLQKAKEIMPIYKANTETDSNKQLEGKN